MKSNLISYYRRRAAYLLTDSSGWCKPTQTVTVWMLGAYKALPFTLYQNKNLLRLALTVPAPVVVLWLSFITEQMRLGFNGFTVRTAEKISRTLPVHFWKKAVFPGLSGWKFFAWF